MNDFSLIVLSFRCYAIHKFIYRLGAGQYNVRYMPGGWGKEQGAGRSAAEIPPRKGGGRAGGNL